MIPSLGVCQERSEAHGADVGVSSVGADRVTAATALHPVRYYSLREMATPPRPLDVCTDADREQWDAAHSDQHTRHRCTLGRMHDGNCRCHCGSWFDHEEQQRADAAAEKLCANCSLYPVASDQDRFCVGCAPLVRAANDD